MQDGKELEKLNKGRKRDRVFMVALAIVTVIAAVSGAAIFGSQVRANEMNEAVTTEIEYRIQEVLASPPMVDVMSEGSIDTDALTDEITSIVTADVLSETARQWQDLSADDIEGMQQRIEETINNSVADVNIDEIVKRVNSNLNVNTDETAIDEEMLVALFSEVINATVEKTLVDVLSNEFAIVNEDIKLLEEYATKNINNLYDIVQGTQKQVTLLATEIDNIYNQLSKVATQEELFQLATKLEQLTIELANQQSYMQMQYSFLESTIATMDAELRALIQKNTDDIAKLKDELSKSISDTTMKINNVSNELREELSMVENNFNQQLYDETTNITNKIDSNYEELSNQIVNNYNELKQLIENSQSDVNVDIHNIKENIYDRIDSDRKKMEQNVTYVDNKVTNDIDITDQRLTNEINQTVHDVNNKFKIFDDSSEKNFNTLVSYVKSVENCLDINVRNIEAITNTNFANTENWVEELDARQQTNLEYVANQLNSNINTMSNYISKEVNTAIGKLTKNIDNEVGAKFETFAKSTATAVNNLGTSVESVLSKMGKTLQVSKWDASSGILYLTETSYSAGNWGKVSVPALKAPTIQTAAVTLNAMGRLPSITIASGQVYVNNVQKTANIVNPLEMDTIEYQDQVVDPDAYINSSDDWEHEDYDDGKYNTVIFDDQGNIVDEVQTYD